MNEEWNKDAVLGMADNRTITYSGKTLCENYRMPLGRCETAAQAIRLYKNCISWALQERYPTKEELLTFADRETLAENGVYIDMEFDGERIDDHICCVFLNCRGTIEVGLNREKSIIPMLYFSEKSRLEVIADKELMAGAVPVELYYDSHIYTKDKERIRVKDYNHLTAQDNVGFTDEEASQEPDMNNELL